ncbi:MAG: hypothetical protein LBL61_01635, partial [Elusimicrobiota bacterium]|nr:hypothetical protein [Elusimicrobiota bacterium]
DFFDDLLNFLKDGDYNYKEIWKNEFLKSNVISFKDGKLSSEVLLEIYREHISCALSDNLSEQKISFVNNITECLLPNIIPLLWFDVYTFNPSDALEENFKSLYDIIKQWCEKDREFGNSGKGYLGEGKKPQWEKETALLILDVYPKLTKKNIKRIIRTIKQMINDKVFKDNSREQKKLLWLKDRDFEIIQKYTGE